MAAKYILAALSLVFLAFGAVKLMGASGRSPVHPQAKAWLLTGAIFGIVASYLFLQQR